MPKRTTLRKSQKTNNSSHKGKKGGVGVLTPEMVGAMAGAAIGGVAGMMLGNRHNKGKLATVKQGAITAGKSAISVLESQTEDRLSGGKTSRKKNTNTKKSKS